MPRTREAFFSSDPQLALDLDIMGRPILVSYITRAQMTTTTFQVNDMTCGHCVSRITKALTALDRDAEVDIQLGRRRVEVRSSTADAAELQQGIKDAGYTPVPVEPGPAATAQAKRGGCGCGCG
jgi:copper chaperone